jgi:hypothetical protein
LGLLIFDRAGDIDWEFGRAVDGVFRFRNKQMRARVRGEFAAGEPTCEWLAAGHA